MKKSTKMTIGLFGTVLALSLLSACTAKKTQSGITEVIVASGADFPPLSFFNEKNELSGFEVDMLRAIDERLPQYQFTYQTYDFTNLLLALESGKIDVAAHLFEYNIEREQKYLYGKTGYYKFDLNWVVREDNDTFHSINDLAGKKYISQNNASNSFYLINKWNDEHGNPFQIIFAPNYPLIVEELENGTGVANLATRSQAEAWIREYNAKIKIVGDVYSESDTYLIFNKQTGSQLQQDIDKALAELKAEKVLESLAVKYLGNTDNLAK
jgi:L-cystine transport system substrate-binding protein